MNVTNKGQSYKLAFVLITSLFFLWGLANNMTDTLLSAFKHIMVLDNLQTSFIQMAFNGAYFLFALPAALFVKRFSYKNGIILGISLYAAGAMFFYPAAVAESFKFYLISIYILAGGCSILETVANPYIMAMGDRESGIRRLNLVQSFNPLGSIAGILLSQFFILSGLQSYSAEDRATMSQEMLTAVQTDELDAITFTFMGVGEVLLFLLILMFFIKLPIVYDNENSEIKQELRKLLKHKSYRFGVVAQFFYVGAQACVWAFTTKMAIEVTGKTESEIFHIFLISIILFAVSRFVFTFLMKYIKPDKLLIFAGLAALICTIGVILTNGFTSLIFLVCISIFMSLMFPTIFGCSLRDKQLDLKLGASGHIMAIIGGAILSNVQILVSKYVGLNLSFVVPAVCFVVILFFAIYVNKKSVKLAVN